MISSETFKFLKDLKNNNNREWFEVNRSVYQQARKNFEHVVEQVIFIAAGLDPEVRHATVKDSIFRIFRDVRFAKDKSPYKTNFGAFIANGGRKGINAGYYFHIEPGSCFLAGGIYMPSGPMLKAIRTEIADHLEEFEAIVHNPSFISHFGNELHGEKLKSAPQGFPKDFPGIDYLKYKSYTMVKQEPDAVMLREGFAEEIQTVYQAMVPFNHFLNRAVEHVI